MKTLIIAEAGVNHNGDIELALRLIEAAAESGADVVKFQTFVADRLITPNAPKAVYQQQSSGNTESQLDMLTRLALSEEAHYLLMEHCKRCNIGFLSTGFDIESVEFLMRLGVDQIKIPSGEITNLPYLRHIGRLNKPILLSTGMSSLAEVDAALTELQQAGTALSSITVLHCTSAYPTPMKDVNLLAMNTLKLAFNVAVGYSDHTMGIEIPIAAVAQGASVIEKHITLDRGLPGPDHLASIEPAELKAMVIGVRNVESALGEGYKRPRPSELNNQAIVRKSLVASASIKQGEMFTSENVTVKRPGLGLSPMLWDHIIGKVASRDFLPNELITL